MTVEIKDVVSLGTAIEDGNLDNFKTISSKISSEIQDSKMSISQFSDFVSYEFGSNEHQDAFMKFIERLFGAKDKEGKSYVNGSLEDFNDAINGYIPVLDNVPEEVQSEVKLEDQSESTLLKDYRQLLVGAAKDTIQAFDNEEWVSQIRFVEDGNKLKVVLPPELFSAYEAYQGNLADGAENTFLQNFKGAVGERKEIGAKTVETPQNTSEPEEDKRPITEQIGDADFDKLKALRSENSEEFAISGRRQREAFRGNRSYSISDEETEYNRYTDAVSREKSENGHYNQEIGGKNKLIQRWSDKHPESGVNFEELLGDDSRFEAININDQTQGIGKLCADNKDLKGLVDERNRLAGERDKRIEKFENVATNQLNYARAKTTEQYHQVGYDKGAEELENSVLKQGNLAHYFSASKHSDVFGTIAKEIENLAPDKNNGMSANGLKESVETAYNNMSDEAKASMHKVDIFKVKLDSKTLGGGKQVLAYAQAMPKVFSAMLSEKVGGELGQEGHPIVDALGKMSEHSSELNKAKKDREEVRSEQAFKDRGNVATRTAESVSDSMAEFSSGVSDNSKIAGQKTWNAGATAVHAAEDFAKAVDNKIDEIGRAAERFSESVDRGVTNAIESASDFAHEKSGGKFHKSIEEEKGTILERLKSGKGKGDNSSVSTEPLSRE